MKTFNTLPEKVQDYLKSTKSNIVSNYNRIENTKITLGEFMNELVDLCHYIDEDDNVRQMVKESIDSLVEKFTNNNLQHIDVEDFNERRLQERRNLHSL